MGRAHEVRAASMAKTAAMKSKLYAKYSKEILICTEKGDCTEEELKVKMQEVVAHELLHAYLNEAGVDLDSGGEEKLCDFYMKNWRKINNSILEILDESGFLDN